MPKSEDTTLSISTLRRFGEAYPGMVAEVQGVRRVVPFRLGRLMNEKHIVHTYDAFAGRRVPPARQILLLLNMALSLLDERDVENARLKKQLEEIRNGDHA